MSHTGLGVRLMIALALGSCSRSTVTTDPSASGVTSLPRPEIQIKYGPSPLEFGHLRLPNGPKPYPVVLFIHGGCWLSRWDIQHVSALEVALAGAGYAVWSLEYRRIGDDGGGWPNTFNDIAHGADYLRVLAPTHGLDLSRLVASGHSAGGELALWLAARRKIPTTNELFMADPLAIQGVLALAPAADLESLSTSDGCGGAVLSLMGGTKATRAERFLAASPMDLAPLGVPETVVVGARDDTWTPIARAYVDHARALGDTGLEVVVAPEAGHFELIDPDSSTWPRIVDAYRTLFVRMKTLSKAPGRNYRSVWP